MHYIDTLKQELSGTKAYEQTSEKEKSVINNHIFHNATRFAVSVNEDQERLPTFYWLPKLHKKPYKARFIANSSSCTTTELSKLLTSCLTTIKNHVIKYCEKVYERSGKNLFWSIKNSCEVLNKLKSRGFRASSLSTYDFSSPPVIFIAGRPKAALLFWFFGDFRCGALLFMVIHVIYKYKNK